MVIEEADCIEKESALIQIYRIRAFYKNWSDEVGSGIETNDVPSVWFYNFECDEAARVNSD